MNKDKLFALGAYGIQAASTLGVVFIVSHLLEPSVYAEYSLVVATSQTAAVLGAEWIRLAALRFCASDSDDLPNRVATVQCAFLMMCLLLGGISTVIGIVGAAPFSHALLGLSISILMGATDLQLVFLRVRGSFNGFARLQAARAVVLLIAPTFAAIATRTLTGTLAGLSAGYIFSMAMFVLADPSWWKIKPSFFKIRFFIEMARYGLAAAGASMTHSLVPMALRWTGQSTMDSARFAGFSLALDLLQKPFALVTSAISGILIPGVIKEYEENRNKPLLKLSQMYSVQTWAVIILLGGSLALLPEAGEWLVKQQLRNSFITTGPLIATIFAAHVIVQTILATPGHLIKSGSNLMGNAALELALVSLACALPLVDREVADIYWLLSALVAVLLADVWAIRLVKMAPSPQPTLLVYAGGPVLLVLGAFNFWSTGDNWLLGVAKICAFTIVLVVTGWGLKRYGKHF